MKTLSNGLVLADNMDLSSLLLGETEYERGYNTEGDVLTQTIDGRDLNEIWSEFNETLSAWNAGRNTLVAALTFAVTTGAGNTGVIGVLILTKDKAAGVPVDVMTAGECVEMAGLTAGTVITADTSDGEIGDDAVAPDKVAIGFTVEATRLIVRTGVLQYDADTLEDEENF